MKDTIHLIAPELHEQRHLSKMLYSRYSICFLNDCDDLLAYAFNECIKVIIYPISHPEIKVLEHLESIKQEIHEASIILITSANSFGFEKAVRNIGVFYYLIRPFTFSDLNKLIEAALKVWERKFAFDNIETGKKSDNT